MVERKLSEILESVRNSPSGDFPQTELRHFQYIVVEIHELNPDDIPKRFAKVVETFVNHNAISDHASTFLLVGYLGVPWPEKDSTGARTTLVAAMLAEHGRTVRVVHGECAGLVGNFGGPRRWSYTALIPSFPAVLEKIMQIEFGTAVEIR